MKSTSSSERFKVFRIDRETGVAVGERFGRLLELRTSGSASENPCERELRTRMYAVARLLSSVAWIESFSLSIASPSEYLSIASCIRLPLNASFPASRSRSNCLTFRNSVLSFRESQHCFRWWYRVTLTERE